MCDLLQRHFINKRRKVFRKVTLALKAEEEMSHVRQISTKRRGVTHLQRVAAGTDITTAIRPKITHEYPFFDRRHFLFLCKYIFLFTSQGYRGSTVVKVLCHKSEGRWFDSRWCHWNFSLTLSFRSHYGPGVDSASNRKECQEYFLGVKAADE